MRLLARRGDRAGVRRVFEQCAKVLSQELGIEPTASTLEAYQELSRLEGGKGRGVQKLDRKPEAEILPRPVTLRPSFPPPPPRLPSSPTPFIGRERELVEIAQLLANPSCRLLTIAGPGGSGKTRLALQTAIGHQSALVDGALFIPLASLDRPEQLLARIADALQLPHCDHDPTHNQVLAYLSSRELLLVLDNLEQISPGSAILSDLLAAAPRLKIMATSRRRMDLAEEWVFDLAGFELPRETNSLPELLENPAVALFVQSARRANHLFQIAEEDLAAILRICRLVDGMPLALEMAAAWSRMLSCTDIADEIARNLDFLTTTARNIPDRQRSMRAAFDYSWSFLSRREQRILADLSILQGGFSPELAAAIGLASPAELLALADHSLSRRSNGTHLSIHELIRQFAAEALAKSGRYLEVADRLLDYCLAYLEETLPARLGWDQNNWLTPLHEQHRHLWVALDGAMRSGRWNDAGRIAANLWPHWFSSGSINDGRAILNQIAARREALSPLVEGQVLEALGTLAYYQNDLATAASCQEKACQIYERERAPHRLAYALLRLEPAARESGQQATAGALQRRALDLFETLNDQHGLAHCLNNMGLSRYDAGQPEAGIAPLEKVYGITRNFPHHEPHGMVLVNLGLAAVDTHRDDANGGRYCRDAIASYSRHVAPHQKKLIVCATNGRETFSKRMSFYSGTIRQGSQIAQSLSAEA